MYDAVRLSKLLALLSSPNDGEALSAARAADRMVQDAGLRWSDIITTPPSIRAPVQIIRGRDGTEYMPPVGTTWAETLTYLCRIQAGRSPSEIHMLDRLAADAVRRPGVVVVSPRQARIICSIYESLLPPT